MALLLCGSAVASLQTVAIRIGARVRVRVPWQCYSVGMWKCTSAWGEIYPDTGRDEIHHKGTSAWGEIYPDTGRDEIGAVAMAFS